MARDVKAKTVKTVEIKFSLSDDWCRMQLKKISFCNDDEYQFSAIRIFMAGKHEIRVYKVANFIHDPKFFLCRKIRQ